VGAVGARLLRCEISILARTALGVRFGRGGMSALRLSPFSPRLRTLVGAAGTAVQCQSLPYAPQQNDLLFDHLGSAGE
jgi:hypothetical protein